MGKEWDVSVPGLEWARECLRVLKPGGHIVAFGGTRTVHRLAVAIEDAGFEIRDQISWLYWSGFPKSLDVSKAIDKGAGAEREVIGKHPAPGSTNPRRGMGDGWQLAPNLTAPATDDAKRWDGWGTALKPSHEPAILARKPLSEATVAANVLKHGTGALNIDACRFAYGDPAWPGPQVNDDTRRPSAGGENGLVGTSTFKIRERRIEDQELMIGRWPANIYACPKAARSEREAGLDDPKQFCDCEAWESADRQASTQPETASSPKRGITESTIRANDECDSPTSLNGKRTTGRSRKGSKSITRTKTSKTTGSEISNSSIPSDTSGSIRDAKSATANGGNPASDAGSRSQSAPPIGISAEKDGRSMDGADRAIFAKSSKINACAKCGKPPRLEASHPTVKPVRLMRWLVRLVTPPGGTVLDPFLGSGTTMVACEWERFSCVGIETDGHYVEIARARLSHARRTMVKDQIALPLG